MRMSALFLIANALLLGACTGTTGEDASFEESGLVQFPASAFVNAPQLTYGTTTSPIAYTKAAGWQVIRWNGVAGDEVVATVASTTPDRTARAYLVEQTAGQYVSVLTGTNGVVKAKLEKTQEYFIVFREYSRRNASFTVNLTKAAAIVSGCTGVPLTEQGIIDRTPQAQEPRLDLTADFESSIRKCNVATGCAAPFTVKESKSFSILKLYGTSGWLLSGSATNSSWNLNYNTVTGEFEGTGRLRGQEWPEIPLEVKGVATTGCVSFAAAKRVDVDATTYYEVSAKLTAQTPAVAPRTAYPATPPAAECEGQAVITDEEVLARIPESASSVDLGRTDRIVEDRQTCDTRTGCSPWIRRVGLEKIGNWQLTASAYVKSANTLGIKLSGQYWTEAPPWVGGWHWLPLEETGELNNGVFTPSGTTDVLWARSDVAQVASISDTHVFVRDVALTTNSYGNSSSRSRRYVCIPIIAHP